MTENEQHAGAPLSAWEARMKEIVREVLTEQGMTVPLHVREENHKFVAECREELLAFLRAQRLRRERWEKIRTHVIGGAILSALGGIVWVLGWFGQLAVQALTHPAAADATQHLDKIPPR